MASMTAPRRLRFVGGRWEVCEDARFSGQCVVLRPGGYPSLAAMGLNDRVSSARTVSGDARVDDNRYAPAPVAATDPDANAQVIFYEGEDFQGRSFTTGKKIGNLKRYGFNDRASSVVVMSDRWEVCENPQFNGRCAVLRPGRYPSLAAMGLNDRVSSVRTVSRDAYIDDNRYAPAPVAEHDYRRRDNERLYQANVTSVRAVVGPPEQRCWVEQEQVPQEKSKANVPGAIAGAVIGGILGHQVGNGRGNDLATVGGAVAGAAVGANVGRSGGQPATTQDVKRCETVPNQARARPLGCDLQLSRAGASHANGDAARIHGHGQRPRRTAGLTPGRGIKSKAALRGRFALVWRSLGRRSKSNGVCTRAHGMHPLSGVIVAAPCDRRCPRDAAKERRYARRRTEPAGNHRVVSSAIVTRRQDARPGLCVQVGCGCGSAVAVA